MCEFSLLLLDVLLIGRSQVANRAADSWTTVQTSEPGATTERSSGNLHDNENLERP